MNGANALIRTLVDAGVDVCFMNPGTSEMHFVAALDDVPEMRGVLALFEGVATGAADGYARMAGRPAATLLHLGPGLGNGLANLHNARKALHADRQHRRRPRHLPQAVRRPARVRHRDRGPQRVELDPRRRDSTEAVGRRRRRGGRRRDRPARPGRHADPAGRRRLVRRRRARRRRRRRPAPAAVDADARRRSSPRSSRGDEPAALFVGGAALREPTRCVAASRIANTTGAKLLAETFPARLERGAGRVAGRPARLPRRVRRHAARRRCATSSSSTPSRRCRSSPTRTRPATSCPRLQVHVLAGRDDDPAAALAALADAVGAAADAATLQPAARPELPTGALTADAVCQIVGALLPEGAIVSDEGNTVGPVRRRRTPPARRRTTGCASPAAPSARACPVAVGAAVACPDRRVIALAGRRPRDVHAPVVVDDGPRAARRHDDPLQQPLVRGAQHGAAAASAPTAGGAEGQGDARPRTAPTSTSSPSPRAWASPPPGPTTAEELHRPARSRRSPTPGPTVIEAIVPSII